MERLDTKTKSILLLPGMDGTGDLFEPFLRAAPPGVETTVIRYPADQPLSYDELLPRVKSQLPAVEDFYLLAESFSGPLAIRLAAASPRGLSGLILCATFARNPMPILGWISSSLQLLSPRWVPEAVMARLLLGKKPAPELRAAAHRAIGRVAPAVLSHRARDISSIDVSALLKELRLPILYLQATQDSLVSKKCGAWIKTCAPQCEVVSIDAPHLLLQDKPQAAWNAIASFLTPDT